MKEDIKRKTRDFTDNVFSFLVEGVDILSTSRQYRSLESRNRALDNAKHKKMFDRIKLRRALRGLKEKGWIEVRRKGKEIEYLLTENGRIQGLKVQMKTIDKKLDDPLGCFVSYDFPVGANKARDQFRRLLKQTGFIRCQDSLWFSDRNIVGHVKEIVQYLKIAKWVKIILGSECGFSGVK